MRLTHTHIEQLFKFTRKHYVYHYDVQSELVDHLANDIEDIWEEKPLLSFEEARNTSFKKFGIFGFMDVIEAKQKQMNKRYSKILWCFFKEWFTVPKVVITAGIFIAIFLVLRIQFSEYVLMGVFLGLIIYDMVSLFKKRKRQKKKEKKNEKIFLLEAMIGTSRNGFTGLALVNLFNCINLSNVSFSSLDNLWLLFVSLLATLVIILFYVITYVIPEKSEQLLQESYPEYKIVKNL
jgi:hypothetical protein